MTKQSNAGPKCERDLEQEGPVSETPVGEIETQESSYDSRKKNLSKREIMDELSRARFPWDE